MEVDFYMVDWDRLRQFESGEAFEKWFDETDGECDWIEGVGLWSPSYRDLCMLSDILDQEIMPSVPKPFAELLWKGLMPLVCANTNRMIVEFPFGKIDSYFTLSISPKTLSGIVQSLEKLNIKEVVAEVEKTQFNEEQGFTSDELTSYLNSFVQIAQDASSSNKGLVQRAC